MVIDSLYQKLIRSFNSQSIRQIFLTIVVLMLCINTTIAQEKKEIEIINADYLKFTEIDGKKYTRLVGDVQLKQDNVLMNCDSALVDKESNSFEAWNNIHIIQDTTHTYAQYLLYNGTTKLSTLKQKVLLTDGKAKIQTEELFYNTKEKLAYYVIGGKVVRESSVITSKRAYYFTNTGDVFFNGNVKIVDPDYRLISDTLKYNVDSDIATFYGNTIIYNNDSKILCDNGWFETKSNVASFGKNTRIDNENQNLYADSLYYDRNISYGKAMNGFVWKDTAMGIEIHAVRGDYFDKQKTIYAFEKAFAIYKLDNDSLFLKGDTLFSQEKSETDSTKEFSAYHHVKMHTRNMQGVCDSLFYSMSDSLFRFYYDPIIWTDSIQMSGDSIHLSLKDKKPDIMTLYDNSILISPEGKYYNQIQGRNIYGYFKDSELNRMKVEGNAESLYFGKDDRGKLIGANRATSALMWLYFGEKKIKKVSFIQKPEAVFTPIKMLVQDDLLLKLFRWEIKRKPKSREEITGKS